MKKPQLFLLHFAGGNAYSFRFMQPHLKGFEIIPLELPGRGNRMDEKLLDEFDEAAEDIFRQILKQLSGTAYFIYGHSLGAYLALKVTGMLEKTGRPPLQIFVSGNAGPGIMHSRKRYLLEEQEFIEELRLLGGVPEEVLQSKELFDFFEPVLRADFKLAESDRISETTPVKTPIYAMMGVQDGNADKIINWKRFTTSDFQFETMEGGHFFILNYPQRIAEVITQYSKKSATVHYL